MIFNRCLVIRLNDVLPRFLRRENIKTGESDNFHIIGKEDGKWFFYRRVEAQLSMNEETVLAARTSEMDMRLDTDSSHGRVIRTEVSPVQSNFYNRISGLPGCRISPVTLEHNGDVYFSVEYDSSRHEDVTDALLEYISAESPFSREIYHLGENRAGYPYLMDLWLSFGNIPEKLTSVKTVWKFESKDIRTENEGIFKNSGFLVPKLFSDTPEESLVWKMDHSDLEAMDPYEVVSAERGVVETRIRTKYFSDFFLNIVHEHGGALFFGAESDGSSLYSTYVIETEAVTDFIMQLGGYWKLEPRKHHRNYVTQIEPVSKDRPASIFQDFSAVKHNQNDSQ